MSEAENSNEAAGNSDAAASTGGNDSAATAVEDAFPKRLNSDVKAEQQTAKRARGEAPPLWCVEINEAHFGAKGRRKTMEDAHLTLSSEDLHALNPSLDAATRLCLYGIFDGERFKPFPHPPSPDS